MHPGAPFLFAAHHRAAKLHVGERILQRRTVPLGDALQDRLGIVVGVEQIERAHRQMRKAAMQMNPASVAALIEAGGGNLVGQRRLHAAAAEQRIRHQRRGGGLQIDGDGLLLAAAKAPNLAGHRGAQAERSRRGGSYAQWGRHHRLRALEGRNAQRRDARNPVQIFERSLGRHALLQRPPVYSRRFIAAMTEGGGREAAPHPAPGETV